MPPLWVQFDTATKMPARLDETLGRYAIDIKP